MLRRVGTFVNSASNATPSGYGFSTPSLHSFAPCLRHMASLLVLVIPIRLRLLHRRTQGQAKAMTEVSPHWTNPKPLRRPAMVSKGRKGAAANDLGPNPPSPSPRITGAMGSYFVCD